MTTLRMLSVHGALLTTGLMAGIYVAFSIGVMPGLARTDDQTYVTAMRAMNESILNGWFAVIFGGPLVLGLVAALTHLGPGRRATLAWLGAALALYVVSLLVTGAVNVPLNDDLAAAPSVTEAREAFHDAWVRSNVVRSVTAIASFAALVGAVRS